MTDKVAEHEAWPARAAGLAVLGALLAVAFERLVGDRPNLDEEVWRSSAASFLAVSGLAFAVTLERLRPLWSLAFALAAGATVGLIVLWNGNPSGWSAGTEWRMVAAGLVVAIAAPLFQAARDAGRLDLSPMPIQSHAWTNIILWFAAWAFVGLSCLLAQLLAELFLLIGIGLLRDALREGWVNALIIGAALGGAIGLLRDRDAMLGQFQRVAVTILSVLAPVLAVGLVLFVAALPFTGLQPLWETTHATTPILLAVIGGAFILANAVLGNAPEEEARGRPLRWSALALAVVMAPLAIVAAISTWLRIDQYGFSPDRLWALVFVTVVLLIATTYLWTVLRSRTDFGTRIRPANVRLTLALCAIGLLLATPLIDFGALSTRDQLARLQTGQVSPEKFDWAALRFDFGPAGRQALRRLGRESQSPLIRREALIALAASERLFRSAPAERERIRRANQSIRVLPTSTPLPAGLVARLREMNYCGDEKQCAIVYQPSSDIAVGIFPRLCEHVGTGRTDAFALSDCQPIVQPFYRYAHEWVLSRRPEGSLDEQRRQLRSIEEAIVSGKVEIRPVTRRQVFIGGQSVGEAFD